MHLRLFKLVNQAGLHKISSNAQSKCPKMNKLINGFRLRSEKISDLVCRSKQKLSLCSNSQHTKCTLKNGLNLAPNIIIILFLNSLKNIPEILKGHSVKIVQNCVQNCEYVLAHRIRRSQQILCLYSKLWDDVSLRNLLVKFKSMFTKHKLSFILSSALVSSFDWDRERITNEDILRYSAEMSLIEFLRDKRKACLKGNSRPSECDCPVCTATDSEWQSFVEEDDIVVWKREDFDHRGKGLYSYKMYARYEDVTAYDFLEAQIDLDYRRTWDTHAVKLQLVDSEPSTNSDVIYWETKWPKLFSNRDYVFKRRYRIDKKRNLIFLVNRITEHPSCPEVPSKQRVSEYWSYMVIKPHTTFDQPGIEFSLTYFDDPGIKMPSTLSLWITITGMPDYLKKLRHAALGVASRRGDAPSPMALRDSGDNGVAAADVATTVTSEDQPCVSSRLLESLRQTLFLF